MVAAMIEQLYKVKDLWDEVAETARRYGPDDPRDGSNVVGDTLAAIDRYTFLNSSPRYGNEHSSYLGRNSS